jgi:hypothetical protein
MAIRRLPRAKKIKSLVQSLGSTVIFRVLRLKSIKKTLQPFVTEVLISWGKNMLYNDIFNFRQC